MLISVFAFIAVIGVTFAVVNSRQSLDNRSKAAVGSSNNIVFVNQNNSTIAQTQSPFVNIRLSSPWPATQAQAGVNGLMAVAGESDVLANVSATFQVKSGIDDVNESDNEFITQDRTVFIGNAGSRNNSWSGFRFNNVTVPKGAKINSAQLVLYNPSQQWISTRFTIAAEKSPNSTAFSSSSKPSSRTLTSARVNHNSNTRWVSKSWYALDNMSTVIQEVVNQSNWQSGNSVSVILKGTGSPFGRKNITSFEGSSANAPRLVISYSTSDIQPTVTRAPSTIVTKAVSPTIATATRTPSTTVQPSTPPTGNGQGFGVIGDSGSDEYRADDNRAGNSQYASTTLSWVELIVKKGVNVGPWSNTSRGEPRRRGYEYNFARSAHKVRDAITTGQHTGMRSLIQAGKVAYVHIEFNGNDYAEWNGEYQKIYNGTTSGTALQTKLDAIISDYTTILDTIKNAGNVKVQVATFPDLNMDPGVIARFPNATNRQRVTNFVNSLNAQLIPLVESRGFAVFDTNQFFMTDIASKVDANGFINIAGEKIDTKTTGDEPHHMILSDTIHAGTIPNGLVANGVLKNFNSKLGTSFPLMTDQEIIQNAGIGGISNPIPTATTAPYTTFVELAEDSGFTKNYVKHPYTSHPMNVTFTFSNNTPGQKTVYARFTSSTGQTQIHSNWIDLVAIPTNTPKPTIAPSNAPSLAPTTPPTGGHTGHGDNSHAMGLWTPNPKYDTCTNSTDTVRIKDIHDSYKVQGPDGKWYPTWHPPVDPTTGCKFRHEHGRDPHASNVFKFLQETYGYDADKNGKVEGAELATAGVPFGYVNEQLDVYNTSKGINNGMRHEDHVGHKIEWENSLMRQWSTSIGGGTQQRGADSGVRCDFFMKIHQGTHSKDAFTNNMHELIQGY
ncbi:MAG TPA: hypothetical protein PLD54_01750, partial [Candidatus Levybacteria bacterium]|nr:hypothetical protein [Candidatus Levybacteria bacterium]